MKSLKELKVDLVMRQPVQSLDADWPLRRAAQFLLEHGFSGAPVVDESEKIVGVLTLKDIARYAEWHLGIEEWSDEMDPEERLLHAHSRKKDAGAFTSTLVDQMTEPMVVGLMTRKACTVKSGTALSEAMSILLEGHMHRVFVVGPEEELLGVVSTMDLVRFFHDELAES